MSLETIQHAWEWLLGLSKMQLILLGGAVSLLVAVSKILRFFFLLGLLVVFLTVLVPEITRRYEQSPFSALVNLIVRQGLEATKDPEPATSTPANPEPKAKEGK
jgi:hypothetical protein